MPFKVSQVLCGATFKVMTSKEGGKNYYKGKGCITIGFNTKHAKFLVDKNRIVQFVVPAGLENFELKPYVDSTSWISDMSDAHFPLGKLSANMYRKLAEEAGNGFDAVRAQPWNWLVNPPAEAAEQAVQNAHTPNPHHRVAHRKLPKKFRRIPETPFIRQH